MGLTWRVAEEIMRLVIGLILIAWAIGASMLGYDLISFSDGASGNFMVAGAILTGCGVWVLFGRRIVPAFEPPAPADK